MAHSGTVVFDLDGTLVDTVGDLVATLNVVLAGEGCRPVPLDEARPLIGHGARALLERGLRLRGAEPDKHRLDALFARFIEHYAANIAVHSRPLPGLGAALDALAARGFRFAVLTNKLEGLSRLLLDALSLSGRFAAVVGGDTLPYRKPDPRVFAATVAAAGGDGLPALMVGDSSTDVETARAAGVPVVVVDFGYTAIPPAELGGDRLISHWNALEAAVAALLPPVPA